MDAEPAPMNPFLVQRLEQGFPPEPDPAAVRKAIQERRK